MWCENDKNPVLIIEVNYYDVSKENVASYLFAKESGYLAAGPRFKVTLKTMPAHVCSVLEPIEL